MTADGELTEEGRAASSQVAFIQPEHFAKPRGYANGALVQGRLLLVAGQIGWETDGTFARTEFVQQFAKALDNVLDVVRAAGGTATDLAEMTVYVTDLAAYRASQRELAEIWRSRFGKHYPAMALIGVAELLHPQATVEIAATAALPA